PNSTSPKARGSARVACPTLRAAPPVLPARSIVRLGHLPRRRMGFALLPPGLLGPRQERCPIGDAVQPTPYRRRLADRRRFAGQDEKGGLESVFGVRLVAEHTTAHLEHHRTVPAKEGMEGVRVAALAELPKEIAVGRFPHFRVF